MYTSRPTNYHISESIIAIYTSMHDNAVITFTVNLIRVAIWGARIGICVPSRAPAHIGIPHLSSWDSITWTSSSPCRKYSTRDNLLFMPWKTPLMQMHKKTSWNPKQVCNCPVLCSGCKVVQSHSMTTLIRDSSTHNCILPSDVNLYLI